MKKMTKKKKLFRTATVLAAVVALGASLAGCGSSGEETTQRYSWPLATASPEDTVTQIFAEKFAEEISELSDGRMKIQVYANSTLGGDRDLLETCADGDIPFVVQNTAPQVSFMGDLAVFDLPLNVPICTAMATSSKYHLSLETSLYLEMSAFT